MKKQISIVVVMAMIIVASLGVATSFADSSAPGKIPVEEYYAKVKAEYAKYGIEYNVVKKGTITEVSTAALNEQLVLAQNVGELYVNDRASEKAYVDSVNQRLQTQYAPEADTVVPMSSMFISKTFTYDSLKSHAVGLLRATIRMTLKTTCEANNKDFVSVNSQTSKQYGTATNFKSWKQTDKGYTLYAESLFAWVTGDLTFQYTEPNTGATVTQTFEEELATLWDSDSI